MDELKAAQTLLNRSLVGDNGEKIGKISSIYVETGTGEPEWVGVSVGGLFGGKTAFAPVAQVLRQGDDAVVVWDKRHLKNAPRPQTEGVMSPQEAHRLRGYYGMERGA